MTFDEWWKIYWEQTGRPHLFTDVFDAAIREIASKAWNAAIEEAAKVVEARGKKIGGAIQPDRTAKPIRALIATP